MIKRSHRLPHTRKTYTISSLLEVDPKNCRSIRQSEFVGQRRLPRPADEGVLLPSDRCNASLDLNSQSDRGRRSEFVLFVIVLLLRGPPSPLQRFQKLDEDQVLFAHHPLLCGVHGASGENSGETLGLLLQGSRALPLVDELPDKFHEEICQHRTCRVVLRTRSLRPSCLCECIFALYASTSASARSSKSLQHPLRRPCIRGEGPVGHSERACLFVHELKQGLHVPSKLVGLCVLGPFPEEFQCGVASDLKARPEIPFNCRVHVCNHDVRLLLQRRGQLVPRRGHGLAVAAPWGKELNKNKLGPVNN
mmetsp:Transcript_42636/g.84097  ORF Transcript_42636/g.84097 Transcript_42636/m.84097 type:complete len:307 (-) Transcript_42636:365-1285(-)